MAQGKVKWFDSKKGYGFITQDNGEEIFCHFTGIKGDGYKKLDEGDEVTFNISQGKKGPQAVEIEKV